MHPRTPRLLALVLTGACQTPEGQEWKTTLGLNTTVAEDYEAEVESFGLVATGEVDYSVTQFELGATRVEPQAGRDIKKEFAAIALGLGEIGDADILELSGGGRFYIDNGGDIIPFLSLWTSIIDYTDFDDVSAQLGLRLGGGAELVLNETTGLHVGLDYLVPLIAAEEDLGSGEVEVEGWALRVGLTFML